MHWLRQGQNLNKMKFHWMVKDNLSPKDLKKTSKVLDFYGYESMLLTFHSDESDYWIKAANAIDVEDKIKYMIAIRPYAITAAYCSMIIKGFNEIQANRLSLNIIAGTHDEDQQLFCSPTSMDERKKSSGIFVKDLRSINDNCPEIFFSGSSNETVKNVSSFGDGQILTLSKFNEAGKQSNRTIVRLSVIISDNASFIYDSMQNIKEKSNTIYGNKEEIISQINDLEGRGVTDLLISNTSFGSNNSEIHEVVLEMIGNSSASI